MSEQTLKKTDATATERYDRYWTAERKKERVLEGFASSASMMDLSLGLEGTHVLITGAAGMIGSKVVDVFLTAGAYVTCIDRSYAHDEKFYYDLEYYELKGDISDEESMRRAWKKAEDLYEEPIACVVALAALDLSVLQHHESSTTLSLEQFRRTLEVNVLGTFLTAQLWLQGIERHAQNQEEPLRNVSLIIIGSESGHWGERGNADYATSKAAVQFGLLQSLKQDAPRVYPGARVNVVAPGPVDTAQYRKECAENPEQYYNDCQGTTALRRPVSVDSVAKTVLWLASEKWSSSVTGQVINVDSGKVGKVVWGRGECDPPSKNSQS